MTLNKQKATNVAKKNPKQNNILMKVKVQLEIQKKVFPASSVRVKYFQFEMTQLHFELPHRSRLLF